MRLHFPSEHVPPWQIGLFEGQTLPHVPQFVLSVVVSAQNGVPPSSPHAVCVGKQLLVQTPAEHTSSVGHVVPHAPQFALSVWMSVQYGEPASGVHFVCEDVHEPTHAPLEQSSPGLHALPHAPQLPSSVLKFAQYAAPPPSGVQRFEPVAHDAPHVPFTHVWLDVQTAPHLPQFALSCFTSTQ